MLPHRSGSARDYIFCPFPWPFIELNRQPRIYLRNVCHGCSVFSLQVCGNRYSLRARSAGFKFARSFYHLHWQAGAQELRSDRYPVCARVVESNFTRSFYHLHWQERAQSEENNCAATAIHCVLVYYVSVRKFIIPLCHLHR